MGQPPRLSDTAERAAGKLERLSRFIKILAARRPRMSALAEMIVYQRKVPAPPSSTQSIQCAQQGILHNIPGFQLSSKLGGR